MFPTTDEQTITCKEGGNFFFHYVLTVIALHFTLPKKRVIADYQQVADVRGWREFYLFTVKCVNVKRRKVV